MKENVHVRGRCHGGGADPADVVRGVPRPKSTEYLQTGAGQYWIVDARDEVIDVYINDGEWTLVAHLDREHPAATVQFFQDVSAELDLRTVLGR